MRDPIEYYLKYIGGNLSGDFFCLGASEARDTQLVVFQFAKKNKSRELSRV